MLILTYWQVYAAMAGSALVCYWAGWGSACLCYRPRGAHAARARAAPGPLPALPAAAAALIDARHANAMAASAPRGVPPARRAAAAVAALTRTLTMTAITVYTTASWAAKDRGGRPWGDATGSLPAVMDELEQEAPAA